MINSNKKFTWAANKPTNTRTHTHGTRTRTQRSFQTGHQTISSPASKQNKTTLNCYLSHFLHALHILYPLFILLSSNDFHRICNQIAKNSLVLFNKLNVKIAPRGARISSVGLRRNAISARLIQLHIYYVCVFAIKKSQKEENEREKDSQQRAFNVCCGVSVSNMLFLNWWCTHLECSLNKWTAKARNAKKPLQHHTLFMEYIVHFYLMISTVRLQTDNNSRSAGELKARNFNWMPTTTILKRSQYGNYITKMFVLKNS